MSKRDDLERARTASLERRPLEPGRIGAYTGMGIAAGVVPLPWVPELIQRRIRGALIHDLTSRHGLSITPDARDVLATPLADETARTWLAYGARFAATKVLGRLGPLAIVTPLRAAASTYVLGHLLERYLDTARTAKSVRIEVEEAHRVRRAIDQAILFALTTAPSEPDRRDRAPAEDLRDAPTRLIDGLLEGVAGVPGKVLRRIEAAFDETLLSVRV